MNNLLHSIPEKGNHTVPIQAMTGVPRRWKLKTLLYRLSSDNKAKRLVLGSNCKKNGPSTAADLSQQMLVSMSTTASRQTTYRYLGEYGLYSCKHVWCREHVNRTLDLYIVFW
ncbi:hypothetical protein AVEN_275303-1 [Araneus ventricosus]|uniref:Uncharacterized protein n=1 Tax=Araneus ventricosus TaxID=182803 RepID=A0A4Y2GBZ0_ARAVE|nr:hypothetical protein AVEN_275303-1 [Araneus ventricosus]